MKKLFTLLFISLLSQIGMAQVNWHLEQWTNAGSYEDPDGWTTINQYTTLLGLSQEMVQKDSIGVIDGNYAMTMTTLQCPNCGAFGLPDTLAGQVGQKHPFTTTPQSMYFSYKYLPNGNDVALAYFQLTRWDAIGDSAITVAEVFDTLNATNNNWLEKNLVFNTINGGTPDSLNIIFFASAGPALGGPLAGWPSAKVGTVLHIDKIYSDLEVSVKEIENDIEFKTYVSDKQLVVMTEEINSTIEVFNMSGQLMLTQNVTSNKMLIDVNRFPTGIYLVKLNTANGVKTNKVVVR